MFYRHIRLLRPQHSIYNSRNYKCFIDCCDSFAVHIISTIVEITNVLQTIRTNKASREVSTIVEITNVLQTKYLTYSFVYNLQQQKLQMFYRRYCTLGGHNGSTIVEITNVLQTGINGKEYGGIYNSRNYKCFIDSRPRSICLNASTIVEITNVLQTTKSVKPNLSYLQQQKLQMFYRQSLCVPMIFYLQQQKLQMFYRRLFNAPNDI